MELLEWLVSIGDEDAQIVLGEAPLESGKPEDRVCVLDLLESAAAQDHGRAIEVLGRLRAR